MSPRPDVSKERKKQILDAAINVFSRSGIEKARMDDIVEESGWSKGTLYWYFKSKDEIILAILNNMFEREFADMEPLLHGEGTVSERLMQFMDLTMNDIQQMLKTLPLAYEFYSLAFRNKTIRKGLKSYFQRYVKILEPVIEEGIQTGEFREINARDVTLAIGAMVEGTILLWVFDPDMVTPAHHGRVGLQLLLDGAKC